MPGSGTPTRVFGEDRVRRLRWVVTVVLAVVGLLALLSALVLARGGDGATLAGLIGLGCALVVGAAGGTALRLLPEAGRPAKRACVATALLTIVAGILLLGTWLAFVLPLTGVGLLFLTLVEDPDA